MCIIKHVPVKGESVPNDLNFYSYSPEWKYAESFLDFGASYEQNQSFWGLFSA